LRVNYYEILKAARRAIVRDTEVERHDANITQRVYIERPLMLEPPAIFIYRDRRDAIENDQRISAGRRVDYDFQMSIWVMDGDFDSVEAATKRCDTLLGKVEVALLNDRTLGGTVGYHWFTGGEFVSGEDNGFYSAAEIAMTARVHATT